MKPDTRWRLALFAVLAPLLSLGFVTSALANRLVFVAWGVGAGICLTAALHRAESLGVLPSGKMVVVLTVYAVALVLFGHLVARHREALDLGFRAALPSVYHPALTHPATGLGGGALCGAVALIAYLRSRRKAP